MKYTFNTYSIVIRGNSHNPTVLSELFLLKSGIITDETEIDRNKLIITPALFQANIKGKTNIIVEPNSLNISSIEFEKPFDFATRYCNNLKYIKANAVGCNFDVEVEEFNFDLLFKPFNTISFRQGAVSSFSYQFLADENTVCNVTLLRKDKLSSIIKFNFHRNISNVILGDLGIDFLANAKKYNKLVDEFIQSVMI